jgi:hypothetical protein
MKDRFEVKEMHVSDALITDLDTDEVHKLLNIRVRVNMEVIQDLRNGKIEEDLTMKLGLAVAEAFMRRYDDKTWKPDVKAKIKMPVHFEEKAEKDEFGWYEIK